LLDRVKVLFLVAKVLTVAVVSPFLAKAAACFLPSALFLPSFQNPAAPAHPRLPIRLFRHRFHFDVLQVN
jgi:hypothetical protein